MTYTHVWSNNIISNATDAKLIDDKINQALVMIEERMNTLIGNSNWSTGIDPVINGSSILSMLALTNAYAAKLSKGSDLTTGKSVIATGVNTVISANNIQSQKNSTAILTPTQVINVIPTTMIWEASVQSNENYTLQLTGSSLAYDAIFFVVIKRVSGSGAAGWNAKFKGVSALPTAVSATGKLVHVCFRYDKAADAAYELFRSGEVTY